MGSGRGWLAGDWPLTGGVLNITSAAWTAGFHWWLSGNIKRMQNVSKYMLVLALCLVDLLVVIVINDCLIVLSFGCTVINNFILLMAQYCVCVIPRLHDTIN